jgi:beta-glucanase (GH16 family)
MHVTLVSSSSLIMMCITLICMGWMLFFFFIAKKMMEEENNGKGGGGTPPPPSTSMPFTESHWHREESWTGGGNGELQWYSRSNVMLTSDGKMQLVLKRDPSSPHGKPYVSGKVVCSRGIRGAGSASFTVRMDPSLAQPGVWPACWLLPREVSMHKGPQLPNDMYTGPLRWPYGGEIDVMEIRGRLPHQNVMTLHFANQGSAHQYTEVGVLEKAGGGGGKGFMDGQDHTFACSWNATGMEWTVDGQIAASIQWKDNPISFFQDKNPFTQEDTVWVPIVNLAVGGAFDPEFQRNPSSSPAGGALTIVQVIMSGNIL